jgi:hypothetical protein
MRYPGGVRPPTLRREWSGVNWEPCRHFRAASTREVASRDPSATRVRATLDIVEGVDNSERWGILHH